MKPVRACFYRWINAVENPEAIAESKQWLKLRLEAVDINAFFPEINLSETLNGRALTFHAPLALIEGAWLQNVAKACNGHLEAVAGLFKAYLKLSGENPENSAAFAYRSLLAQNKIHLAPTDAWLFAQDDRIGVPALEFARLQLAMALNASFDELLGFSLAYGQSRSNGRLYALPERESVLQSFNQAVQSSLKHHVESEGVHKGFALFRQAEALYLKELKTFIEKKLDLNDQAAALLKNKLPYAQGYHRAILLEGKPLDEWFSASSFDMNRFRKAFKASKAYEFEKAIGFGGPMFGVFDKDETRLLMDWFKAEDSPSCDRLIDFQPDAPLAPTFPRRNRVVVLSERQWFYKLLNEPLNPDETESLRLLLEKKLKASHSKPALDYAQEALEAYIFEIHQKEVARYRSNRIPKLSKEEYAWFILQFSPTVLTDGCWLQKMGDAAYQDDALHRLLYKIYADELGFGHPDWNHANLFRDLLQSIGFTLPAIESQAFSSHSGFLDSAFDIPVYLLAIGCFPKSFLAEILGLNLAIELSGLGAGYMHLADDLRFLKINPAIVNLHLSIDNLANGHARLALKAIHCYLDDIRKNQGESAVQAHWHRIWAGYVSLKKTSNRFKIALAMGFCLRFLPKRIERFIS